MFDPDRSAGGGHVFAADATSNEKSRLLFVTEYFMNHLYSFQIPQASLTLTGQSMILSSSVCCLWWGKRRRDRTAAFAYGSLL
jgi:hypothetical protein